MPLAVGAVIAAVIVVVALMVSTNAVTDMVGTDTETLAVIVPLAVTNSTGVPIDVVAEM